MFDYYLDEHLNFIKNNITSGLIVYKGFPSSFIEKVSKTIPFICKFDRFDSESKIQLNAILENRKNIIQSMLSANNLYIITIEEFIMAIRNINPEIVDYKITIINNDLFNEWYPNPSNIYFPDQLDEIENKNKFEPNKIFEHFYTSSKIVEDQNFICYPDINNKEFKFIQVINFFESFLDLKENFVIPYDNNSNDIIELPSPNDKFLIVKKNFYDNRIKPKYKFIISEKIFNKEDEKIKKSLNILGTIASDLSIEWIIYVKKDDELNKSRKEFAYILQKYWGSNSFRKLLFYKDPDFDNKKIELSQDQIIEFIVQQSELANDNKKYQDVFITAPTGSGKSLLFQIPSIYLEIHKKLVTIVVSPLKALMYDQVVALNEKGIESACYINSDISYIDRQKMIDSLKNGEKSILYLSPELLLSYSISEFIGKRQIGLLVIDEAHLVSTWGRDFRVDYWYLGKYIRNIRKYYKQNFPIVALTATAVYGGNNDIVFETIESLNMLLPKLFIGNVRRDEIQFIINPFKYKGNHEDEKIKKTAEKIENNVEKNIKTIFYFPWIRQIDIVISIIQHTLKDKVGRYYGQLEQHERKDVVNKFKNNVIICVLATKAFGMGVDISDILEIYHHAPSGNLSDYVQEIGRVARKKSTKGKAIVDYSKKDLKFTRILYGLSSVKLFQIKFVIEKIYEIYKKKKKQNLLFSVEDFQYVFSTSSDCESKVKSALLLIENDFYKKYGYYVILVRPKSLYTTVYAEIPSTIEENFLKKYGEYCKKIYRPKLNNNYEIHVEGLKIRKNSQKNNFYKIELDKLWEKYFYEDSFPNVKWKFFKKELFYEFIDDNPLPLYKLEATLNFETDTASKKLDFYWTKLCAAFQVLTGHYFTGTEFENKLSKVIPDKIFRKRICDLILAIYSTRIHPERKNDIFTNNDSFLQVRTENNIPKYRVISTRYYSVAKQVRRQFLEMFYYGQHFEKYLVPDTDQTKNYIKILQQLETFKICTYEFSGGKLPRIFVRINDPFKLRLIINDNNYNNYILNNINNRHESSMKIMEYFFSKELSDIERWDFIENYFLGRDMEDYIC